MTTSHLRQRSIRSMTLVVIPLVVILAGVLIAQYARPSLPQQAVSGSLQSTSAPTLKPITANELDAKYGIRVTLVAVTAAGGLIDVRFRVQDSAKAGVLFLPGNLPSIITEDGKAEIRLPEQPEAPTLTDGQIYFLLYPNTGGAVKPGSKVVLAFRDLGFEYQVAP